MADAASERPQPRSRVLARLFTEGRRIFDSRPDLQQRFGSVEGLDYWIWMMSAGVDEYPELAACVPVPPMHLIDHVVSAADGLRFFQESGLSEARQILALLMQHGFVPDGGRLLEFGCGCARILRYLARLADSVELHGADPDRDAIAWCRANLDYAQFELLGALPPSSYAPATFRAVYAYSVFTHLAEDLHRVWLAELARITAPGALLVLTTQGRRVVEELLGPRAGKFKIPSAPDLRAAIPALEAGRFVFFPYDFAVDSLPADMAPSHGMAFLYPDYVRRHWQGDFEVLAVHEGPSGWQDYVVLRRR